jgi:hypothetical protein
MVEAVLKAVSNSLTILGLTSRMATSSIMGWMFLAKDTIVQGALLVAATQQHPLLFSKIGAVSVHVQYSIHHESTEEGLTSSAISSSV